jgi:DNA-binding LacI/PurR family transcriptional regulator
MSKRQPPTIYDVARTAGVSITTVSRVLNAPELVNEATRVNVLAAIDKLGFVPKAEARARALRSSGRVGVITPFFTSPSFAQRLRGVASVLTATNYELVIYTVDTLQRLNSYLETLPLRHTLDGLILVSVRIDESIISRLIQNHLEPVLIEFPVKAFNSVQIDDIEGGKMAAHYLLDKGHTQLVFVGEREIPAFGINPINLRLQGFKHVLEERKINFTADHIWETPHRVDATRIALLEKLKQPDRPTAIFAATDLQAVGVLRAARQLSIRVPEDLAVLGFDDLDIADYVGLSTIRQPLDESGRIAAELLFSQLLDPNRPAQQIQLPLTLVERETT